MFNTYYEAVEEKERLEALYDIEYKINTHMNNGLAFYTLVLLLRGEEMNLPSEQYFREVKTKEQWQRMVDSGLGWELEPFLPFSWAEHQEMCEYRFNMGLNKEEE